MTTTSVSTRFDLEEQLKKAAQDQTSKLDFSHQNLNDEAAEKIAEFLKENNTVVSLNLRDNSITDTGSFALEKVFHTNTTLKFLQLKGNKINPLSKRNIALLLDERRLLDEKKFWVRSTPSKKDSILISDCKSFITAFEMRDAYEMTKYEKKLQEHVDAIYKKLFRQEPQSIETPLQVALNLLEALEHVNKFDGLLSSGRLSFLRTLHRYLELGLTLMQESAEKVTFVEEHVQQYQRALNTISLTSRSKDARIEFEIDCIMENLKLFTTNGNDFAKVLKLFPGVHKLVSAVLSDSREKETLKLSPFEIIDPVAVLTFLKDKFKNLHGLWYAEVRLIRQLVYCTQNNPEQFVKHFAPLLQECAQHFEERHLPSQLEKLREFTWHNQYAAVEAVEELLLRSSEIGVVAPCLEEMKRLLQSENEKILLKVADSLIALKRHPDSLIGKHIADYIRVFLQETKDPLPRNLIWESGAVQSISEEKSVYLPLDFYPVEGPFIPPIEIDSIQEQLKRSEEPIVLLGPRGAGKTYLARYLFFANLRMYQSAWFDATSSENLLREYRQLGLKLKIIDPQMADETVVEKVKDWMEKQHEGFFVFDNAECFTSLRPYFPARGKRLVTSNRKGWEGYKVHINEMDPSRASKLVKAILRRKDCDAPKLVQALGGNPHVLSQAVYTIIKWQLATIPEYLEQFRTSIMGYLKADVFSRKTAQTTAWQSLESSWQYLTPNERRFLRICCLFAEDQKTPLGIIESAFEEKSDFLNALKILKTQFLCRVDKVEKTVELSKHVTLFVAETTPIEEVRTLYRQTYSSTPQEVKRALNNIEQWEEKGFKKKLAKLENRDEIIDLCKEMSKVHYFYGCPSFQCAAIVSLTTVEYLDMNEIKKYQEKFPFLTIREIIKTCANLKTLSLSQAKMSPIELEKTLDSCSSGLEILDLSSNTFGSNFIRSMMRFPHLKELDLTDCRKVPELDLLLEKGVTIFILGEGIASSIKDAVRTRCFAAYENRALAGDVKSLFHLGLCFQSGCGVGKNEKEAVKYIRLAAEQGYAAAQCNLGVCYDNGQGVEKNEKEAVKYYTLAAEQGQAAAQCNLGVCYYLGQGVEKNEKEAVKYYTLAAEQGQAAAQCNLGMRYEHGQGVEKNETEAVKFFTLAAEQGQAAAQYNLGVSYANGQGVEKNETEAVKYIRLAAEQGYAAAQCNLGMRYEHGQGVEKNETEAVKYIRLAAEQGDAAAQCNLGFCYEKGQGVEKNEKEAVKYYTLAAEQGHARAQCNLGFCYEKGQGVEKNEKETVKYIRLAAEQGYAAAQCNLGVCYDNGQGVEKNEKEAVKYYTLAAEQGYAAAQCNLGACYYLGQGVEKNEKEAVKYYTLAAEQGYAAAQCNLGACYYLGQGVEKNEKEAVKYIRLATEQGYAAAQYKLGSCYVHGQGVEKNEKEAVKYYTLAAEQGYASAQCNLGFCYEKGQGVEKNEKEAVKYIRLAAEQGNVRAQYKLGFCYKNGLGVRKNKKEAVKYYTLAAGQGYAGAQYKLGSCYVHGQGVEKNEKEAVKYYTLAAGQGYAGAQYKLGSCYVHGQGVEKNEKEAVKYYILAAEQGNVRAQYKLGSCYENGQGVEKNEKEAVKYYTLAAGQGNVRAQYKLGSCYENGQGVEKNEKEAVKYYILAAEQGNATAQCNLGNCYYVGRGVERNKKLAVSYYMLAVEQGYADAQCNLGNCCANGEGVKKHEKMAVKYYMLAAKQGHVEAQFNLGNCYANGEGVERDEKEAVKYFTFAAEQGYADAQNSLGFYYTFGLGVERNEEKVVKYYKLAAEQGLARAQYNLGDCYYRGQGVERNKKEAVKYYTLAAEQGHVEALYSLGLCYENGEGVKKDEKKAGECYKLAAEQGHAQAQS